MIQRVSLPNTSFITNYWDDEGRLTETDLKNSSSTILNKHAYVYNNANQRTVQTRADSSYQTYYYDDVGQLYDKTITTSYSRRF